jgi:LuxR family maltose regulon positive regulatory protein
MGMMIETLALRALALNGQGRTDDALDALCRALSLAQPQGYVRVFLDLGPHMEKLLFRFSASPAVGGKTAASAALQAYVTGLLRAFAEQAYRRRDSGPGRVADATTQAEPSDGQLGSLLLEPLTDREAEVLDLLVAGLSNREIAERLTIALGTAKRHVSNIYAKLDVHSRVKAVDKARALHLV